MCLCGKSEGSLSVPAPKAARCFPLELALSVTQISILNTGLYLFLMELRHEIKDGKRLSLLQENTAITPKELFL